MAVLVLGLAGAGLAAEPKVSRLLPDATVLTGLDGKLVHADANDAWWFELMDEIEGDTWQVPAGTRLMLLPSAVLERLIADVNDRYTPEYRLAAEVTRYGDTNYLLATYFLPLSKFKSDEPQAAEQEAEPQTPILPADPDLTIPPEIIERLKNRPPVRGPLRKDSEAPRAEPAESYLGRMLVNRVGRIEASPAARSPASTLPRLHFTPYALGWNVSGERYELLPCRALEQAQQIQRGSLDPVRFNVAGLVTRFQGKQYLRLVRAIPVYNYGNFGR